MTNVVHTFLKLLSDNLSYPIKPVRISASDPSAGVPEVGAINVTFLDHHFEIGANSTRVVLDVLFDTEAEQFAAIAELATVLGAAYYTPTMNYADPSTPVAVGGHVYWDKDDVSFMRINVDNYCHHTCVLTLRYA